MRNMSQSASRQEYRTGADSGRAEQEDREVQRAARDAVMEIQLFPDLAVKLKNATGYGPHVDMLQHFCYWFHPRHPKMRDRWTMYKTYQEWREECGLARKQVDKGREALRKLGLVTEKKGPHGRVHYRVDWVAVANVLSLSPIGEQTDDVDDDFDDLEDEISLSPVGEQGQFVPQGEQGSLSPVGEHANTGENAGEYLTENSLLQSGAEPAFAESAPPLQVNKENVIDLDDLEPLDDKRHSQEIPTQSETTAARGKLKATPPSLTPVEVSELMRLLYFDKDAQAFAHECLKGVGPWTLRDLSKSICRQLDKPEHYAERYLKRLPEALEELRPELEALAS